MVKTKADLLRKPTGTTSLILHIFACTRMQAEAGIIANNLRHRHNRQRRLATHLNLPR